MFPRCTLRFLSDREGANAVTINCGRFTEESARSALVLHAVSGQPTLMATSVIDPGNSVLKRVRKRSSMT
jgi:hypothetical protein